MNENSIHQQTAKSNPEVAYGGVFAGNSPAGQMPPFAYQPDGQRTAPAPARKRRSADNPFPPFARAGYEGRLLPIVPPGADISPNSSLARPERQKDIGKTPGVRGVHGWHGLPDWQKIVSTAELHEAWGAMEAGVGMKMGDGLIAVDIDVTDKALSELCGTTATQTMGASRNRIGRRPRRAKLYRTSEPVPYQRITFDGGVVEILSDGKQLVVHGIHPATGQPYEWDQGLPRFEELPIVSAAQVTQYLEALASKLPKAKVEASSLPKDRQRIDPAQLTGREFDVRRAMEALPNDFPDRETYINVGLALKGALPDDQELGFELFDAWAAKWTDYNADTTAADWRRCKPSHTLGASYLFSLAERHGRGAFNAAETWFTAAPAGSTELNPFEVAEQAEAATQPAAAARPRWKDRLTLKAITAEERRVARSTRPCIVENWFYDDVGHLAAPGGVGKTTLLLFQVVHIVLGWNLFGQRIKRSGPVIYLTAEDDRETVVGRLRSVYEALKLTPEQAATVDANVFVLDVSGSGFKVTAVDRDVVVSSDGLTDLIETIKPAKPTLLIVDTMISVGVGENRVNDAEQGLIEAGRRLRNEVGCGVLYVHHTGQQVARDKITDQYAGRGGSALSDGSRMVHVMQSLTPDEWVKATGDTLQEDESGVVYARPKITWAPPNQPPVYLKRIGYLFERFGQISSVEGAQAQLERNAEELLGHLKVKMLEGVRYSRTSIEDTDVLKTRNARRAAVRYLMANGRILEEVAPTGGRPQKLLRPVEGALS